MAASTQVADTASASPSLAAPMPGPAKFPVASALKFILIGAVISSLGFGGVLYYFARTDRLVMRQTSTAKIPPSSIVRTHLMVLDPLLVNLAGDGGSSYLRLSLALQLEDSSAKGTAAKNAKDDEDSVAAIRDTALTVLGRQTADNLLAQDGKERLKAELKKSLAEHNGSLKITDLFFTDFLVQR